MVQTGCVSMFVLSRKKLYLHCFSRHRCEMSTTLDHPHSGCLFSAMSITEEVAIKNLRVLISATSLLSPDICYD